MLDTLVGKASRWVQDEVGIIKSLEVYEEIDLDDDPESQVERVVALSRRATVFISYSPYDYEVALAIRDALVANDYNAWLDTTDIALGDDWRAAIDDAIDRAIDRGFFLLLMSAQALESAGVLYELERVLARQDEVGRRGSVPADPP